MRPRELLFGTIALVLLVGYSMLGARAAPLLVPAGTLTPTPARPSSAVPAPHVSGTIAFMLRADVYVPRDGQSVGLTAEGRRVEPNLALAGNRLLCARVEPTV